MLPVKTTFRNWKFFSLSGFDSKVTFLIHSQTITSLIYPANPNHHHIMYTPLYPTTHSVRLPNGYHTISPRQSQSWPEVTSLPKTKNPLSDQLVIRFAGKNSEPQQIVALAQQGKSLDTISAMHLQQALLYLPQLLNNNVTGPSNNPEPPTRISSSMTDLEFTAKRLAYALGQKGEVDLLRACLQEPDFQQSPLRKSVIHNLLRFDTSRHNYKLSREIYLPESISDYESMSNKTVNRNLQEYLGHLYHLLHLKPDNVTLFSSVAVDDKLSMVG